MIPAVDRRQARALDELAVQRGVPSILLMENAGRGAAERVAREMPGLTQPILVLCGPGNNGGDGLVVARRLVTLGYSVRVFLLDPVERLSEDARINYHAWCALQLPVTELFADLQSLRAALPSAGLVIDALFGTGLTRPIEGLYAQVIELANAAQLKRVALDLPSGLDADSGRPLGATFQADITVTFAQQKLGLLTPSGKRCAGETYVVDIGVPADLLWRNNEKQGSLVWDPPAAELVEARDVRAWLPVRAADLHKGSAGKLTVLGGSAGKSGAALLAARGALRIGAGLVTICNFPEAISALEVRVMEAMTSALDPVRIEGSLFESLEHQGAIVVGPGLGLDSKARSIAQYALNWPGPKLFDADALSLFAGKAELLAKHTGELVLTPHSAELARLLGVSVEEIENDRFGMVERASRVCQATVLLKGPYSLVRGAGGGVRVNPTGGPALATGGSGDVLSGAIGALLTRLKPFEAAAAGAFLHGLAGDLWGEDHGADAGLLASELADRLPAARARLFNET